MSPRSFSILPHRPCTPLVNTHYHSKAHQSFCGTRKDIVSQATPASSGGTNFPRKRIFLGVSGAQDILLMGFRVVFFVMRFRAESARRSWVLACFLCTWNLLGTGSAQKIKGSRRIPESVFPLASAANQQRCRERRIDSTFASLHERQSASGLNPSHSRSWVHT
jgi:hypothetical protein